MFYPWMSSAKKYMAAALVIASSVAMAEDEKMDLSGFIGIGAVRTTDNNFLGSNTNAQTLVDAGLQARYAISENITATGQVTYRRMGEITTDDEPRFDIASLDIYSQLIGETQISIGRVKPSTGLYTETRDLPMSRPSIIMPQSIYSDFFRDFLISLDGARVSISFPMDWASISFEGAYGKMQIDDKFNEALLGKASTGNWESDISKVIDLKLSTDQFLFNVSQYKSRTDYTPGEGDALPTVIPGFVIPLNEGFLEITTHTAGMQYSNGTTELTFEYIVRDNTLVDFVPDIDSKTEGWYSQVRHSFSRELSVTLRNEVFYRNKKQRNGSTTPPFIFPDYANVARTSTFGLSWQLTPSLQATTEVHYVKGSGWLAPFSAPLEEAFKKKHWMLFATQVTYRF